MRYANESPAEYKKIRGACLRNISLFKNTNPATTISTKKTIERNIVEANECITCIELLLATYCTMQGMNSKATPLELLLSKNLFS